MYLLSSVLTKKILYCTMIVTRLFSNYNAYLGANCMKLDIWGGPNEVDA